MTEVLYFNSTQQVPAPSICLTTLPAVFFYRVTEELLPILSESLSSPRFSAFGVIESFEHTEGNLVRSMPSQTFLNIEFLWIQLLNLLHTLTCVQLCFTILNFVVFCKKRRRFQQSKKLVITRSMLNLNWFNYSFEIILIAYAIISLHCEQLMN